MQQTNLTIANAPLPATYEAAKTALASCSSIDECADWADKAQAMASYGRQAGDEALYKMALRIQARAVRRLGELLKQYDAQGQRTDRLSMGDHTKLSQKDMADRAGISKHQQVTAVRVASIPESTFEGAIEGNKSTTITALAEMGKQSQPARQVDPHATLALSTLDKFADFCIKNNPLFVASAVGPSIVPKMRRKVSDIDAWLDQFVVDLKG